MEGDAGSVREREIHDEQVVVDLACSELDRQLARVRHFLVRTEARSASDTY